MNTIRESIAHDACYQQALDDLLRAASVRDRVNRRSPYFRYALAAFQAARQTLDAVVDSRIVARQAGE